MASLLERSFACSILWAPNITATAVMGSRDHDRGGTPTPQAATSVTSLATAGPRFGYAMRLSSEQCRSSVSNWVIRRCPPHVRFARWSQRVDATLYPERERWSVRQCVEVIFEALRHQRKQSFGIAGSGASR